MTVDPAALTFSSVASVSGSVRWIGRRPAGWVVAFEPFAAKTQTKARWRNTVVSDLATRKLYELKDLWPSVFMLDRKGRLWIGEDRGEWGGSTHRLDLATGKLNRVAMPGELFDNVYGFIELANGHVAAFGGVMHMGLRSWFVTRVDCEPAYLAYSGSNLKEPRDQAETDAPERNRPHLPITHIIENREHEILVLSFSDVFRTKPSFKTLQRDASLHLRYFPGRPDAVGSYPAIRKVRPLDREGQPLLLVTGGNGHVLLDHGRAEESSLTNQFGQQFQESAMDSPIGFLTLPADDREETWGLNREHWSIVNGPPTRLSLRDSFAQAFDKSSRTVETWYGTRFAMSPGGSLCAFTETSWSPGTRGIDRWQDGRFVALDTSMTSLSVKDYFFAPNDDVLARDDDGEFKRLHDGNWQTLGVTKKTQDRAWPRLRRNLKLLSGRMPPWLYFDSRGHELVQFDPGDGKKAPSELPVALTWKGKKLAVLDVIAESDDSLLVASEVGLLRYNLASGTLTATDLAASNEPVYSLARDGKGRLWVLGKELYLIPAGDHRAQVIRGLPVSAENSRLLGTTAAHPSGVVVGLNRRGIVFVETEP